MCPSGGHVQGGGRGGAPPPLDGPPLMATLLSRLRPPSPAGITMKCFAFVLLVAAAFAVSG